MVAAFEQNDKPRLTTFKNLVEASANIIAEDLEQAERFKRRKLPVTRSASDDNASALGRFDERSALAEFDRLRIGALRSFVKVAAFSGVGSLVLNEFHTRDPSPDPRLADLIAAMLAAITEADGRLWLDYTEGRIIAESLERTGDDLLSMGFPRFAERAFAEAADIHARFNDTRARHRCRYRKLDSHRRSYAWLHPMRFVWGSSRWLFGYGYRPLRLLLWTTVAIVGFAAYLLHLPRNPGASRDDALFVALQNFVSPLGLSDAKSISPKWEAPLEVETYVGYALRIGFLMVFIRRWLSV